MSPFPKTISTTLLFAGLCAAAIVVQGSAVPEESDRRAELARYVAGTEPKRATRPPTTPPKKKETAPSFVWPVKSRRILEGYGERVNPETKTVTLNPGINIAARKGTLVQASAAGTVSVVSWLPGYGTLVIVEHRLDYRTVYANLSAASIAKGARVRSGQRIGTVGKSADGEFLHFEVWRDQTRLDPMTVLRRE